MFKKLSFRLATYLAAFVIISLIVFLEFKSIEAQTPPAIPMATDERDAIAVRVLPNPNNYSVTYWYNSQGFSGSPQSLVVDGYQAIRDGRTIYVNAANIAGNNLYTNIYLISHNQDPDTKTIDILGRIINHWKFNSNLTDAGKCSIATKYCQSNNDCDDGTVCQEIGDSLSMCRDAKQISCLTDAECPGGLFCDSVKAKVTRDVQRLGALSDIRASLTRYQSANGTYPILGAGTYISHNSVSTWPSWRNVFLSQLGLNPNLIDPINILGPCPDHDLTTCWNETTGTFADPINNNQLNMPGGSYAIAYSSDPNGSNYFLCSVLESHMLGYNTPEGAMSNQACVTGGTGYTGIATGNQPPQLVSYYLQGESGQEFSGFFRVMDPENNPLSWVLDTDATSWPGWSLAPTLQDTGNPNQKRVYASRAGNAGSYLVTLKVSDSLGANISTTVPIIIGNPAPFIEMSDIDYYLNPINPLEFSFNITDNNLSNTPTNVYTLSSISSPNILVDSLKTHSYLGNTLTVNVSKLIPTSLKFYQDTVSRVNILARDTMLAQSTLDFKINLKITPPRLDFVCPRQIRAGSQYFCLIGSDQQGDFNIQYSSNTLPSNIALHKLLETEELIDYYNYDSSNIFVANKSGSYVSDWILTGQGADNKIGAHNIIIKATNNYGASTTRQFVLNINNYCGDGVKQTPNTEGRGGFYNDGNEDCDGNYGITTNPESSSINQQYACSTPVNSKVIFPILTGDHCIFKSPYNGGGYCGDGLCQATFENSLTCPVDCGGIGINPPVCGNGIVDANEQDTNEQCEIINNQINPTPNCVDVPGANYNSGSLLCQNCQYNYSACTCQLGYYDCDYSIGCESTTACPTCVTSCDDKAGLAAVNDGLNCGYDLSRGTNCGTIDCPSCNPSQVCAKGYPDTDCSIINSTDCPTPDNNKGFCTFDNGCSMVVDAPNIFERGRMFCMSTHDAITICPNTSEKQVYEKVYNINNVCYVSNSDCSNFASPGIHYKVSINENNGNLINYWATYMGSNFAVSSCSGGSGDVPPPSDYECCCKTQPCDPKCNSYLDQPTCTANKDENCSWIISGSAPCYQ